MKVEEFKLIDDGFNGISVIGKDTKKKGEFTVYVDASLRFKVPIPKDLVMKVQKLKLFFLQLTGYWEERYAAYLNKDYGLKDLADTEDGYLRSVWLFDHVSITGLKAVDGYYIIKGKIENKYGQTIGMATPKVNYETNYGSFEHLVKIASEVVSEVEEYVNERKLRMMDSRQYLLKLFEDAEPSDLDVIDKMTEEERNEKQMEDLQEKGYFVVSPNDLEDFHEEEKDSIMVAKEEEEEEKKTAKEPVKAKANPKPAKKAPPKADPKMKEVHVGDGKAVKEKKKEEDDDFDNDGF